MSTHAGERAEPADGLLITVAASPECPGYVIKTNPQGFQWKQVCQCHRFGGAEATPYTPDIYDSPRRLSM